jgi:hypothetical protein
MTLHVVAVIGWKISIVYSFGSRPRATRKPLTPSTAMARTMNDTMKALRSLTDRSFHVDSAGPREVAHAPFISDNPAIVSASGVPDYSG